MMSHIFLFSFIAKTTDFNVMTSLINDINHQSANEVTFWKICLFTSHFTALVFF